MGLASSSSSVHSVNPAISGITARMESRIDGMKGSVPGCSVSADILYPQIFHIRRYSISADIPYPPEVRRCPEAQRKDKVRGDKATALESRCAPTADGVADGGGILPDRNH